MEVVMRVLRMIAATAAAVALVIVGLWAWQAAADLVSQWPVDRPEVTIWAIRCGAIALAALGQVLVLRFGVRAIYRRRALDDLLGITSAVACVIAAVSAVALGLAGK
jgi:hypothetical protein